MLYALRYEKHTNNDTAGLIEILKKMGVQENLIKAAVEVVEYGGTHLRQSDLFGHQDAVKTITKRLFKVLYFVNNYCSAVFIKIITHICILGFERRGKYLHSAHAPATRNIRKYH